MYIAYVINVALCVSAYNGIRIQAETWAQELEHQGHKVVRVNPWEKQDWDKYDLVHVIGADRAIDGLISSIFKKCKKICFSPIIDTIEPVLKYKIASYMGCKKLRLYSVNYAIRQASQYIDRWFVRSHYELMYVNKAYSIPLDKISIVPLSPRIPAIDYYPEKEDFCLHVSILSDVRKNVYRLVEAAIKYKFNLVLAGSISSEKDFVSIKQLIETHDNVKYLGRVSDQELYELYSRAKVFALPSISEGVGMVAVEAASYGCDIVVTEFGGPKEYYGSNAFIVNPYNVDDIGLSIVNALRTSQFQPELMNTIKEKYGLSHCVALLIDEYKKIIL